LGRGCVQEEIRFLISPELIVSKFLCHKMEPNEVIIITGAEKYSKYTGYASSYQFVPCADFVDNTERDDLSRIKTQVIAMDALYFKEWFITQSYIF